MNLKPRRREEPEINLISLIDVVLMLVVFFMLSSTFVKEGRLQVKLPHASEVPTAGPSSEPLVVTVTQQGGYRVNERELINSSADTLRAAVLKEAGADRKMGATLRADAGASHQSVITALNVLGKLGFAEVSVATINEEPERP
jgi:biopolymer transport protein ExbD